MSFSTCRSLASGSKSITSSTRFDLAQEIEDLPHLVGVQFAVVQQPVDVANEGEQLAQGLGHVQIVVHRVLPAGAGLVEGLIQVGSCAGPRGRCRSRATNSLSRATHWPARCSSLGE